MNIQQANSVLDTCYEIFQSFGNSRGMRIKKDDHYEGVNRVFEWTENGILKAIVIEFMYSNKPTFEISIKAFNRVGLLLHRYGGFLRHMIPLMQWYKRHSVIELPRDIERLPALLNDAYQELSGIDYTSLQNTRRSDQCHIHT